MSDSYKRIAATSSASTKDIVDKPRKRSTVSSTKSKRIKDENTLYSKLLLNDENTT